MPYNQDVADRLQNALAGVRGLEETHMFGGIGYLLNGDMCVGVNRTDLILRLGQENLERLQKQIGDLREMDFTGRPMKGWGMIGGLDCEDDDLQKLINEALQFTLVLPKKAPAAKKTAKKAAGKTTSKKVTSKKNAGTVVTKKKPAAKSSRGKTTGRS